MLPVCWRTPVGVLENSDVLTVDLSCFIWPCCDSRVPHSWHQTIKPHAQTDSQVHIFSRTIIRRSALLVKNPVLLKLAQFRNSVWLPKYQFMLLLFYFLTVQGQHSFFSLCKLISPTFLYFNFTKPLPALGLPAFGKYRMQTIFSELQIN